MLTQDLLAHFGSGPKAAEALGITPSAIYQWGDFVPLNRQYQIEVLTGGALKADRKEEKHHEF